MKSNAIFSSQFFFCAMCSLAFLAVGCDGAPAPGSRAAGDATMEKAASNASESESETAGSKEMMIGSTAPPLDIQHWITNGNGQFSEVTTFTSGNVYVVEFWATWCPPCIASMPHLVELQNKFEKQGVQIISVSREDLSTVNGLLSKEVRNSEADAPLTYGELTSAYCLTTDPDGSVHSDYMEAAKQRGIPCAFIVGKSGLIEWIGHPLSMDTPLEKVVSDQWDRDQFAVEFKQSDQIKAVLSNAARLASQGKFDEAQELLGSEKPNFSGTHVSVIEEFESSLKLAIIEQLIESGDTDDAIMSIEKALEENPTSGVMLYAYANLLHQAGDLDRALEVLTKALENPGRARAEIEAFLEQLKEEISEAAGDSDSEGKSE